MNSLRRVVWSEGMHLGPHHFQAQSRYFEDSIRFCTSAAFGRSLGAASLELDAEALKNGTVSLLHASGMMPDGLAFNMPEDDALPEPRGIAPLFPPTRSSLTVLLAVPAYRPNDANCALPPAAGNGSLRYSSESRPMKDEVAGVEERAVSLGRKNFRLLADTEPADHHSTLAVARILRSGSGEFVPDPEFIPPCIRLAASARLLFLTGRLIDILDDKSSSLGRSHRGPDGFQFTPHDVASFWFLHTVNEGLAMLRHQYYSKRGHPEELFLEMSRLAGGLCTFALDAHPRTLPVYDHQNLDLCFHALDARIRALLDLFIPVGFTRIELAKAADYFYTGAVADERCLGRAAWYLGVRSPIGEVDLVKRVPQLAKICSEKFVGELVKRAIPGLAMTHVSAPPPSIPVRSDTQYFLINRSGPFWENIVQTRRVGVYLPGDVPEPELELLVALDS